MNPRQSITELFSTFAALADDRFICWISDRKLRRNALKHLEQAAKSDGLDDSEYGWVLHWHRLWQKHPENLASGHLSAYLQEPCYWVARKMTNYQTGTQNQLSDCFQMAIVSLPDILKRYSPNHGASLKTYASLIFGNTIRDSLRQQREADIRTDWGLLRKLSQKRLVESLQQAGLSADAIASYVLAWTCFKTLWSSGDAPATRRLSRPDQATWDAIAQLYNQQRSHHLPPTAPKENPETLERWLLTCAKQVRAYLYPATTSLNLSKSESGAGELQDDLPDRSGASPLTDLITQEERQERQTQQAQVSEVLTTALTTLDPQIQTLLDLYYCQQLTQQQIATQLDIKQYTVSRRLSSAKESLLLKLAQWSQGTLHISPTSTAVSNMSVVLEEWLQEKVGMKNEE